MTKHTSLLLSTPLRIFFVIYVRYNELDQQELLMADNLISGCQWAEIKENCEGFGARPKTKFFSDGRAFRPSLFKIYNSTY